MKLSDAIEEGSKHFTHHTEGGYYDFKGGACVLGMAAYAISPECADIDSPSGLVTTLLGQEWHFLYGTGLLDPIVSTNDQEILPLHGIILWLRSIGL